MENLVRTKFKNIGESNLNSSCINLCSWPFDRVRTPEACGRAYVAKRKRLLILRLLLEHNAEPGPEVCDGGAAQSREPGSDGRRRQWDQTRHISIPLRAHWNIEEFRDEHLYCCRRRNRFVPNSIFIVSFYVLSSLSLHNSSQCTDNTTPHKTSLTINTHENAKYI